MIWCVERADGQGLIEVVTLHDERGEVVEDLWRTTMISYVHPDTGALITTDAPCAMIAVHRLQ